MANIAITSDGVRSSGVTRDTISLSCHNMWGSMRCSASGVEITSIAAEMRHFMAAADSGGAITTLSFFREAALL